MFDFIWDFFNTADTVQLIAVSAYIGASLACIMYYVNRTVIGKAVRVLIEKDAHDPESALTIEQLGLAKNPFVRSSLKGRSALRKLVSEAEDREVELPDGSTYFTRDKEIDLSSARFYIKDELRARAEVRYSSKGTDLLMLLVSLVLFLIVAYLLTLFVPFIINLFHNVTSS